MSTHTPGPRDDYIGDVLNRLQDQVEAQADEITYLKAYQLRVERRYETKIIDLLDLARNVGGFDDRLLLTSDLNVLRQALQEWRDQARAAIAKAEGVS